MTTETKLKAELMESFQASESVEQMLKNMREMEKCFQESELGMECWALARKLTDPDKILYYGIRALNIFVDKQKNNVPCFSDDNDHNHGFSLFIPCVLNILGSACLDLEMLDEGLSYLLRADKGLSELLEEEGSGNGCRDNSVLFALLGTHQVMFKVNVGMGKGNEALVSAKRVLEIREKTGEEEDCIEIGEASKDVGVAYLGVKNFREAWSFSLKALEIYKKHVGYSKEIALVKKNLQVILGELGDEVKVLLELSQLSLGEMEDLGGGRARCGDSNRCISKGMLAANTFIVLGLYEEAITVFKTVVARSEGVGNHQARAVAFLCIARVCCKQGELAEAKRYMKIAQRIFEKKDINPVILASAFEDMSKVYAENNEYDNAILYLKKAMAIPELPQDNFVNSSTRVLSLITMYGKLKKEISFMDEVVGKLREKLGPEHVQVGLGYINLGTGYILADKPEAAVEVYVLAKCAFDASLGPHNMDSLRTSQAISVTYARLGRYDSAIAIQSKVVESLKGLKGQGSREQEFLNVAVKLLKDMKERVSGPAVWSWKVLSRKMADMILERFHGLPDENRMTKCCLGHFLDLLALSFEH